MTILFVANLLSFSNIMIYVTANRVTYVTPFSTHLFSPIIDNLLIIILSSAIALSTSISRKHFLLTGSIIAAIFSYLLLSGMWADFAITLGFFLLSILNVGLFLATQNFRKRFILYLVLSALLTTAIIESLALSGRILFISGIISGSSWFSPIIQMDDGLFYAIGLASPLLMLALASSLLLNRFTNLLPWIRSFLESIPESFPTFSGNSLDAYKTKHIVLFLVLLFVATVIISYIPYLPKINSEDIIPSTDIWAYESWLNLASTKESVFDVLLLSFMTDELNINMTSGDRPLTLLTLYVLQYLFGSTFNMFKALPILLGYGLATVIFYTLLRASKKFWLSALASSFTIVSYHFVIGIYGGFIANWLALIFQYALLISVLLLYDKLTPKRVIIVFLLLELLAFTHTYTWSYFIFAIIIFSTLMFLLRKSESNMKKTFVIISLILLTSVMIDYVKSIIIGAPSGIGRNFEIAFLGQFGVDLYATRWGNLGYAVTTYLGGFFTNSIILALSLIWALRAKILVPFNGFMLSILLAALPPLLLGNYNIQSRIMYDMPIYLIASIMTYELVVLLWNRKHIGKILLSCIIIHVVIYAVRALSNLTLIIPQ